MAELTEFFGIIPKPGIYKLYSKAADIGFADIQVLSARQAYFKAVGCINLGIKKIVFHPRVLIKTDSGADEGLCFLKIGDKKKDRYPECPYTIESQTYNQRCLRITLPEGSSVVQRIRVLRYPDHVAVGVKISYWFCYIWVRINATEVNDDYLALYKAHFSSANRGRAYKFKSGSPDSDVDL
ncbi:hypothetical protein [Spongorhabdus nitratireducens]